MQDSRPSASKLPSPPHPTVLGVAGALRQKRRRCAFNLSWGSFPRAFWVKFHPKTASGGEMFPTDGKKQNHTGTNRHGDAR